MNPRNHGLLEEQGIFAPADLESSEMICELVRRGYTVMWQGDDPGTWPLPALRKGAVVRLRNIEIAVTSAYGTVVEVGGSFVLVATSLTHNSKAFLVHRGNIELVGYDSGASEIDAVDSAGEVVEDFEGWNF